MGTVAALMLSSGPFPPSFLTQQVGGSILRKRELRNHTHRLRIFQHLHMVSPLLPAG